MPWVRVAGAIINGFKEMEKENENAQRALNSIQIVAGEITGSTRLIMDRLERRAVGDISTKYKVHMEGLRDYQPVPQCKYLLTEINSLSNQLYIQLKANLEGKSDAGELREIVNLMTIITLFQGIVVSELNYTFKDSRSELLLEQLKGLGELWQRVIDLQAKIVDSKLDGYDEYNNEYAPAYGTPGIGTSAGGFCACGFLAVAYESELLLKQEDEEQKRKVEELIAAVEGSYV